MAERVAVVLFNLGGPDGPDAVQPFLKNLFSDPAIIRSPAPVRFFVSRLISKSRAPSARENYARMGGGSPLLPETRRQANALDAELKRRGHDARSFIAMRYWKPYASDVVRDVKAFILRDRALNMNLLGMSYLSQVRWRQQNGELILEE